MTDNFVEESHQLLRQLGLLLTKIIVDIHIDLDILLEGSHSGFMCERLF